jgi:hypothetical protein
LTKQWPKVKLQRKNWEASLSALLVPCDVEFTPSMHCGTNRITSCSGGLYNKNIYKMFIWSTFYFLSMKQNPVSDHAKGNITKRPIIKSWQACFPIFTGNIILLIVVYLSIFYTKLILRFPLIKNYIKSFCFNFQIQNIINHFVGCLI